MIHIRYNGAPITTNARTVLDVLQQHDISYDTRGIAVACNGTVIRRDDWEKTPLHDGDTLEVVKPFQGG